MGCNFLNNHFIRTSNEPQKNLNYFFLINNLKRTSKEPPSGSFQVPFRFVGGSFSSPSHSVTHTQKIEQILRKIEQILPLKKNTTSKNNRLPQYKPLFNYPSKISLQNNTTPTPKKDLHHPNNQNKV